MEGRRERRAGMKTKKGINKIAKVCLVRTHSTPRNTLRANQEERAARKEKRKRVTGIELI